MEPATSWFLVGFVNHCATTGTPTYIFFLRNDCLSVKTCLGGSLVAQRVKDPACHCCGSGDCCGAGSIPGLGTTAVALVPSLAWGLLRFAGEASK